MADKDAGALARLLAEARAVALPVGLPGARALGRDALAVVLRQDGVEVAEAGASVAEALAWAASHRGPGDRVLVTGSHVTVAEALDALDA